jgi:hypothetical protein
VLIKGLHFWLGSTSQEKEKIECNFIHCYRFWVLNPATVASNSKFNAQVPLTFENYFGLPH